MTRGFTLRAAAVAAAWFAISCDAHSSRIVEIELPVRVDTLPGRVDTLPGRVDTLIEFDTTFVFDTTRLVARWDTTEVPLDVSILDYGDRTTADLAHVSLTVPALVWARIELSGNSQKDEAWQLQADGQPIGAQACPVVPDHPPLGTDWVFVGWLPAGDWELRAVHAILVECYPPTDYFRTANSVHFEALRLVSIIFEEEL